MGVGTKATVIKMPL